MFCKTIVSSLCPTYLPGRAEQTLHGELGWYASVFARFALALNAGITVCCSTCRYYSRSITAIGPTRHRCAGDQLATM